MDRAVSTGREPDLWRSADPSRLEGGVDVEIVSDTFPLKQLARWISIVAHPFVMVALLVAVPATRQSPGSAVQSVLLIVMAVVVPIVVLMIRQVRRGRWSDADASKRSERPLLFVVTLVGMIVALGWLLFKDPQSFLIRGLIVTA